VTFPAGKTAQGMPIGIQVVGRRMEDEVLLRVVHAFQQATDWHRRKPASLG
jgi:aspartyl-tRNA(Asn)/glutamyl-tRNA(Gln) amidotransferase subunit A